MCTFVLAACGEKKNAVRLFICFTGKLSLVFSARVVNRLSPPAVYA